MGAYGACATYATKREQFVRPIGGFQLVRDLLVSMLGNFAATQAMMLRLAQRRDEGVMLDEHATLANAFAPTSAARRSAVRASCSAATGSFGETHRLVRGNADAI
jgi:glutaryl-CoA dehydrogenase